LFGVVSTSYGNAAIITFGTSLTMDQFFLELYSMEDLLLATSQMETQHPAADNQSSNQTGTSLKLDKFSTSGRQFTEEKILGFHGPRTSLGCIQRPFT
jgi:hypothetical protein